MPESEYTILRDIINNQLIEHNINDYELFGAGASGEQLSLLEYEGALRVIGPSDPEQAEAFIRIVQDAAAANGFNIEMDRPPSVTHAFGQTIRDNKPNILYGRPVLYVYKRYKTYWPTWKDRDDAIQAGASEEDIKRMYGPLRFYENRISQIGDEITEDPHGFQNVSEAVAEQIYSTPEFMVIREEMADANDRIMHLRRAIHMPVKIGDHNIMIHFLAESRGTQVFVDILKCPSDIKENILQILSEKMMV